MKRILLGCILVLIACSNVAFAEPAMVFDSFGCVAAVPNEQGGFNPWNEVFTTESHKVITDKGVSKLTCHFDHDEMLLSARGERDFLCYISGEIADESRLVATPGGKLTMVCKINNG